MGLIPGLGTFTCHGRGPKKRKIRYIHACTHVHMHTHTVEYNSAMKKNEMLPFAATWINLVNIILSEVKE